MAQRIHYRDAGYFLDTIAKALKDGFAVDIDAELFADRIVSDIRYLDGFTQRYFSMLESNDHLIDRLDHFRTLYSTVRSVRDTLEQALSCNHPVLSEEGRRAASEALPRLRECADRIHEILAEAGEIEDEDSVVSRDELSELLK